jgi:hypothetical protein
MSSNDMVHYWPPCKRCGKPGYAGVAKEVNDGDLGNIPIASTHAECYPNEVGVSTTFVRKENFTGTPPYAPCCVTGSHEGEEDDKRRFPPNFFDAHS